MGKLAKSSKLRGDSAVTYVMSQIMNLGMIISEPRSDTAPYGNKY
jgi:hypothetical protein